ncbi:ABC transporter ATP-binding protein [Cocleimonas flava]|uniref:Spermidine/putrescine transport system ATP-binding protein n=1 Tax=Cocleimonas flava TaxID=634765 RepID=A0A4R1F5R8_9GAMM|nr:ABC transporter ATP-binding protein [Cocleimonas flava]TCJ88800.1 spermidine/putrescine transport system ATP-binding protein [Cocleimonas flava]
MTQNVTAKNSNNSTIIDLETRNVNKHYGDFTAVDDVSLKIEKGSFFSILGPSGCGKTTLLRMIAGFDEPDSGDILIQGSSVLGVPANKRPANMVFQHLALFPMMSVADNVAYGLKQRKVASAEINKRVKNALESVDLGDSGKKKISQLSGGQKQRIAIARCLVLEPKLLLLDEPLGALDLKLREHMKVELKQMQSRVGTTFIYITHDQSEALVMSNKVAVMNNGAFEQVGTPSDLYYHPETSFVAGFVGDANKWQAKVTQVDNVSCTTQVANGPALRGKINGTAPIAVGEKVDVFVRPEAIKIVQSGQTADQNENSLQCTVVDLLFNGANSTALLVDVASGKELHVALPQTGEFIGLQKGEALTISWSQDQTHCFSSKFLHPRADT